MARKFLLPPIALLLVLIASEIALRRFDFWGIDYFYDQSLFYNGTIEQDGYIVLPSGVIEGKRFTATILDDGTRAVPDTQPSDCQIVFIGDSLTFGFGVNDDETFANLIGINITDAEFINAGVNGYNSQQVRESMARFPDAAGFIWTVVSNDAFPPIDAGNQMRRQPRWYLQEYFDYMRRDSSVTLPENNLPRFAADVNAIVRQGSLLLVYGADADMWRVLDGYEAHSTAIDKDRFQLALTDSHPNADGHQDLANRMLPHVRRYISEVC